MVYLSDEPIVMTPSYTTAPDDPSRNENGADESPAHTCSGVIPRTFIMCGEGSAGFLFYCSDECLRRAQGASLAQSGP